MLYKILYWTNRFLSLFRLEIRKKSAFPTYYLQYFLLPDVPHENGIYTVSIDKIISPHGFSNSPKGWHYYAEFLKQYEKIPDITYDQSILKKYYDVFQPESVADILFYDSKDKAPEILNKIPPLLIRDFWRLDGNLEEIKASLVEEETQLFGPISDIYGEEQFIRCINAHRLIKKHGYIPERFEDGYIGGFFIRRGEEYRFQALAGKHRLAALSVLGYKDIKATCPYNLKILDVNQIEFWPTVQSGLFTKKEMQTIIEKYFGEDGTGFAQHYGLKVQ